MYEEYIPEVVQAIAGEEYSIYAYFSDGKIVKYDVAPLIMSGGVFSVLADRREFADCLTVLNHTAAWDLSGKHDPADCIDIDPYTLYASRSVQDPLSVVI